MPKEETYVVAEEKRLSKLAASMQADGELEMAEPLGQNKAKLKMPSAHRVLQDQAAVPLRRA